MPLPAPLTARRRPYRATPGPATAFGTRTWKVAHSGTGNPVAAITEPFAVAPRTDGPPPRNVYVHLLPDTTGIALRDSKDPDSPALFTTPQEALNHVSLLLDPNPTPDDPDQSGRWACRRPYCNYASFSLEKRKKHEADPSRHPHEGQMDYLCDWVAHADAIEETGMCSVCQ